MTDTTKYFAVTHPLTGDTQTTIFETTLTPSQLRKHIESGLITIRAATPRELLDCGGKTEKAGGGT